MKRGFPEVRVFLDDDLDVTMEGAGDWDLYILSLSLPTGYITPHVTALAALGGFIAPTTVRAAQELGVPFIALWSDQRFLLAPYEQGLAPAADELLIQMAGEEGEPGGGDVGAGPSPQLGDPDQAQPDPTPVVHPSPSPTPRVRRISMFKRTPR